MSTRPSAVHKAATWAGAGVTLALLVGSVVLVLVTPAAEAGRIPDIIWPVPFAAMALVGALVANRRADNATGWLLFSAGAVMVANAAAQAYTRYAYPAHPEMPAAGFVTWVGLWTWLPATFLLALVFIVFPTGAAPTRFWRWVVRAVAFVFMPLSLVAALPTLGVPGEVSFAASPSDVPGGGALAAVAEGPTSALLPLGFVALIIRFFRARGVERLQMKWFVFGAAVLALATIVMFGGAVVLGLEDPIAHPLGGGSITVGTMAIPVAAGVAIMRYRLYDIDRIISRTLSYAVVTALLGGMFALLVLGPALVVGTGKRPDYLVAAATLVVATLFRPVRRRVQSVVDRRFNRARYDAARTVEAFSTRLREQTDLDALGNELRDLVDRTMHPVHVSLWVRKH